MTNYWQMNDILLLLTHWRHISNLFTKVESLIDDLREKLLTYYWHTIDILMTNYWQSNDKLMTNYSRTIDILCTYWHTNDILLTYYWQTIDDLFIKVESLIDDLRDGVRLLALLEVLSGERLPMERGRVLRRPHYLSNINTALEFLRGKRVSGQNIINEMCRTFSNVGHDTTPSRGQLLLNVEIL